MFAVSNEDIGDCNVVSQVNCVESFQILSYELILLLLLCQQSQVISSFVTLASIFLNDLVKNGSEAAVCGFAVNFFLSHWFARIQCHQVKIFLYLLELMEILVPKVFGVTVENKVYLIQMLTPSTTDSFCRSTVHSVGVKCLNVYLKLKSSLWNE